MQINPYQIVMQLIVQHTCILKYFLWNTSFKTGNTKFKKKIQT